MKTFYSILSAILHLETNEKVSVGLVVSDGNQSSFEFSGHKISALKSLLPREQYSFIKEYVKSVSQVSQKIDSFSPQYSIHQETDGKNIFFTETYFEHLSVCSQNVLSFSKPVRIDLPMNSNLVKSLFEKLVEIDRGREPISSGKIQKVRASFLPTVKEYFCTEREIDNCDFAKVLMPLTVDLLGKNEIPVFAKFLELERNPNHIKSDFYDLTQLRSAFRKSYGFVVAYEPRKDRYKEQHLAWQYLRRSKKEELVDISEVEKIREYAIQHGVTPF